MTKMSDAAVPSLLFTETANASIGTPAAGKARLFRDTDNSLKWKDEAGAVTTISGGSSGIPADGWVDDTAHTWTYASATTFTIAGTDLTAVFRKGTRLKLTQTTVKYFVVVASSFSTNTTVTITGGTDYTFANAAVTANYYSHIENPQGWPDWFAFTTSATGFSSTTTNIGRFQVNAKTCTLFLNIQGTSNATSFTVTLPFAAAYGKIAGFGLCANNGANPTTPALLWVETGALSTIALYLNPSFAAWTSSGGKHIYATFPYEF